jgi:hypothetical protein
MPYQPATSTRRVHTSPEEIVLDGWLDQAEPYVSLKFTDRHSRHHAADGEDAVPDPDGGLHGWALRDS